MRIKDSAEKDRPRERLMEHGAEALTDAELLAILIGSGTPKMSAVELMTQVLADVNNDLNQLSKMSIAELCQYNGIGEAKAITILAATELGRRRKGKAAERQQIKQSSDIFDIMHEDLRDSSNEQAWALLLNNSNKLIKKVRLSQGGLTETLVDVRMVLREALLCNAVNIALCHNHPSGNPRPSGADDTLTKNVAKACETMRLRLIDHVIIVEGTYYSYSDEGKI